MCMGRCMFHEVKLTLLTFTQIWRESESIKPVLTVTLTVSSDLREGGTAVFWPSLLRRGYTMQFAALARALEAAIDKNLGIEADQASAALRESLACVTPLVRLRHAGSALQLGDQSKCGRFQPLYSDL